MVELTEKNAGRQIYCVITDASGNSVTTDTVTMTKAAEALTITQQPVNWEGRIGETATFTVEAEGEGLSYQWYIKNPSGTKFSKSSITANVYTAALTESNAGRQLYCVVKDGSGNSVTTETVTMTKAAEALTITQQPENWEGRIGETATFTVEAAGEGLSYQWYIKNPGGTKFSRSSIKTNVYTAVLSESNSGRQLYCVITAINGNSITSETVTMTEQQQ